MTRLVSLLLIAGVVSGCAAFPGGERAESGLVSRPERVADAGAPRDPSQSLALALQMLAYGDASGAAKVLRAITQKNAVPGVTDEALFRLALLSLRPNVKGTASRQGYLLLKRLKAEYPRSPWTVQAVPLMDYMKAREDLAETNEELAKSQGDLTQRNRKLEAANESLSGLIKQQNRIIEELKKLDLELEQKSGPAISR